jgi:lipoprotein-anchoring transpeptidase ErfK/SrfK
MNRRPVTRNGIAAAVVGTVAVAGLATALLWPDGSDDDAEPGADTVVATVVDTTAAPGATSVDTIGEGVVGVPEASTLVASFASDATRFDAPNGTEAGVVAAEWHGRPSILPVVDQKPGWVQVRLAERPNGSTAWVRRSDVVLATTPYRVEIDVATTRLRVYKEGEQILDAPAGLGTEDAPTTVGNFFVAFLQEPPDTTSGWGPFVVVTSSHSETISDFQSSGDAVAAIHGPLGADDEIGETGAYVSHGCIRLHLDDLDVLRDLPAGTPIDVVDSGAAAPTSSPETTSQLTESSA